MNVRKAIVLIALFAAGCLSAGTSRFVQDRGACVTPPALAGQWYSSRASQMGAASMTFTFTCDCRYTTRAGSGFARVTERGEYRVENGSIILSRASAETSWPFELDGDTLRLTEAAGETHEYSRTARTACR